MKLLFLLGQILFMQHAFGQGPQVLLDDSTLGNFLASDTPDLAKIEAAWSEAVMIHSKENEKLTPELYTGARYEQNKARTLIDFQPIYSPIMAAEIGVRKKFRYGLSGNLGLGVDQRTGNSPTFSQTDATTTVAQVQLQLDLWKDLFGRTTKANLESARTAMQRAELLKKIQRNSYHLGLRKIYWALIANNLSSKITAELLDQAVKQAEEAKRRKQKFVSDDGEVARYMAQVSSRQSVLYSLSYLREKLLRQLRSLAPELLGKEIIIPEVNVEATIKEILACTAKIGAEETVPFDFTNYDEMVELLREEKEHKLRANETYSDVDVQLFASAKTTGVDRGTPVRGNVTNSIDDLRNNDRAGYGLGFQISLPLDKTKKTTEEALENLNRKRYEGELNALLANLSSSHEQIKKNIVLIQKVIQSQRESSHQLGKRLAVMKLKFAQARASVVELINDQDSFLSSELDVVDSQLSIINLIFDYFDLFPGTPCDFNRKA